MPVVGFHASHELFSPRDLLRQVQRAELAGFQAAMCSDHFHPWTPSQGQSGYSFAWLGAAMQATSLPLGTICCPFERYHPAIVAQAAATLQQMFPDRFWLALGTGQALNEHITGNAWPPKPERQAKLRQAAEIIRSLWAGDTVTLHGRIRVEHAKLYSRPAEPPLLLGAATTAETAQWVGRWADGLLTVNQKEATLREILEAFRSTAGSNKPVFLQAMVGYDPDEETAWELASRNWPVAILGQDELQNIATPEEMAQKSAKVRVEDLKGKLRVSSSLAQHQEWIAGDFALGFDAVYLYTISGHPQRFIDALGEHVLPAFK